MTGNLAQGVLITLAGMGLVFLVLALLWLLMALLVRTDRGARSSRADTTASAEQGEAGTSGAPERPARRTAPRAGYDGARAFVIRNNSPFSTGQSGEAELSPELLAAVMVAVRMHRRVRRKQAAPAMRTHQPGTLPSRWVGVGRASQNQSWHPHQK